MCHLLLLLPPSRERLGRGGRFAGAAPSLHRLGSAAGAGRKAQGAACGLHLSYELVE